MFAWDEILSFRVAILYCRVWGPRAYLTLLRRDGKGSILLALQLYLFFVGFSPILSCIHPIFEDGKPSSLNLSLCQCTSPRDELMASLGMVIPTLLSMPGFCCSTHPETHSFESSQAAYAGESPGYTRALESERTLQGVRHMQMRTWSSARMLRQ